MIKLSGVLFIRSIQGRNGPFSVGRLVTGIGEFAIKDALLDQYDEGRYEGEFGVSRIYPSSYLAANRMVIEVRATLQTMALAAIDDLPADAGMPLPEPDPMETEPAQPPQPVPPQPAIPPRAPMGDAPEMGGGHPGTPDALPDPEDESLFGVLWPLGATVKLDTTVERGLFRRQKDRLKALGYRFNAVGQTWTRAA